MKCKLFVFIFAFFATKSSAYDFETIKLYPQVFPPSNPASSKILDSSTCDSQLNLFSNALSKRELWAMQMVDTWAKVDSGYLLANTLSLGHYTACVKFRHQTESFGVLRGQHCLVTILATPQASVDEVKAIFDPRNLGDFARTFGVVAQKGFCLPASCSTEKVVAFANKFLIDADLRAIAARCQTDARPSFKALDIIAIIIFLIFGLLLVSSTIYDLVKRTKNVEPHKLYISFSAYTNGKNLFDIVENKSPSAINCLNGLRAISVLWIIFGHRIGNQTSFPTANSLEVIDFYTTYNSAYVTSYTLAVDTFFLMGGLLVTWSVLHSHEKGRVNVLRMIWTRYIRYTPAWAAILLFYLSIEKFFVEGHFTETGQSNCVRLWWATLLHIQNYVDATNQCLNYVWYLSADFQLFIVSPFLIYPAIKYGRKYLWSLPTLGLMSNILVFVMMLVNGVYYVARTAEQAAFISKWVYFPTHARIAPWMVGMTLGYILFKLRTKQMKMSNVKIGLLYWLAINLLIVPMAATYFMLQPKSNQNRSLLENVFFAAFHRHMWSLGIAWLIFACHHLKSGGPIKWILELRYFQPISRMGLSMYLVHPIYQMMTMINLKQSLFLSVSQMLHLYFGDVVVVIALGAILYCTIEAPIILIDAYFYKKRQAKVKLDSDGV